MTATRSPDRLYGLLPAVFREQDAVGGEPLRALLAIVAGQVDVVEQDIAGLWNDLFIETCDDWVIAYIGDLVSNTLLYDPSRIGEQDTAAGAVHRPARPRPAPARRDPDPRRRRQDHLLPPAQGHAADARGARARRHRLGRARGRVLRVARLDPAPRAHPPAGRAGSTCARSSATSASTARSTRRATASTCARSPSTRAGTRSRTSGSSSGGWAATRCVDVPARPAGAAVAPFTSARSATPRRCSPTCAGRATRQALSTELHVPGPIRRAFFRADLDRHRTTPPPDFTDLYGTIDELGAPLAANPDASLFVMRDGQPVAPAQVVCARLDPWPAARPTGAVIGVDVAVGRIAVGDGFPDPATIDVTYHYGFPADIGGGPYDRRNWLDRARPGFQRYEVHAGVSAPPTTFPSVAAR